MTQSPQITSIDAYDVRFPTSRYLDGSDAMNPDPDYSLTYVIVRTDAVNDLEGHGFTFTIGRGNDLCVSAVKALAPLLVGVRTSDAFADMGRIWKRVTQDRQLRWLGPEKGIIHLATAALVNAVWDLYAKHEDKPLWQLVADMSPEEFVGCVDFRYLTDAITPAEAREMVARQRPSRDEREKRLRKQGYPAYTTSAGWLGYSDEKVRRLCREEVAAGWQAFKLKVGADPQDDLRRARIMREEIGPDGTLLMDANQYWDVPEAIERMKALAEVRPLFIEEPTSPDDILGHAAIAEAIAPIGVATGEHAHNRVMFKQLMQARGISHCQIDSARLGGVNEVLAVLLLAAKFEVPVWPHAGGVGLCEYVQHLSIIDYLCVSGELDGRRIEYIGHLHEHFRDPVVVEQGAYQVPTMPGYSAELHPLSLEDHLYPSGRVWQQSLEARHPASM